MKQIFVGSYYLGREYVDVILTEENGGCYYLAPEKQRPPRIKIGIQDDWQETVSIVLHEIQELCMDKLRCRYDATNNMANDHSSYLFILDHITFSDVCARVGKFLADALPDIAKKYSEFKKNEHRGGETNGKVSGK